MRVRHKPGWYLGPLASGSPTASTQGMHYVSACTFWLNVFDCWRYMHGGGLGDGTRSPPSVNWRQGKDMQLRLCYLGCFRALGHWSKRLGVLCCICNWLWPEML